MRQNEFQIDSKLRENSSFGAILEKFQNNGQSFGLLSERAGFEPSQVKMFFFFIFLGQRGLKKKWK